MASIWRCVLRSIAEGNSGRLSKLLGKKTHFKGEDLTDALLKAVSLGQEKCVFSLLSAGADPNTTDDEGRSVLHLLIEQGGANPLILKQLLKYGATPNKTTWSLQQTALHIAAKRGYQVCIKILIHAGSRVDKRDSSGNTALMYASKEGHTSAVKALIREGADVNYRNLMNESALHFAARSGHQQATIELLQRGASPNCRDTRGLTPMFVACRSGHMRIVSLLLDYNGDVNAQDSQSGKTPLHWAIQHGSLGIVMQLLDNGADVNIRDRNWQTPFMVALTLGKLDILELLLHTGCNVTTTDSSHNTALHLASQNGQTDLIALLVGAGINVNIKGERGLTPLMLASFGGYVSIVGLLLKYGAHPDLMDRYRSTALMYSILSTAPATSCHEIVKILIRTNCDLNQCANLKNLVAETSADIMPANFVLEDRLYSPMEAAFLKSRPAIFMMLVRAGCDIDTFKCDKVQSVAEFKQLGVELKQRWFLLRCLQRERGRVRSLRELCRKPLLKLLSKGDNIPIQQKLAQLPLSDQLKSYLNFTDLDEVENEFDVTFREPKAVSAGNRNSDSTALYDSQQLSDVRRHTQSPNSSSTDLRSRTSRSSVRYSREFVRDSSKRKSLPPGFYSSMVANRATSASPVRRPLQQGTSKQGQGAKRTFAYSRSRSVPVEPSVPSDTGGASSQGSQRNLSSLSRQSGRSTGSLRPTSGSSSLSKRSYSSVRSIPTDSTLVSSENNRPRKVLKSILRNSTSVNTLPSEEVSGNVKLKHSVSFEDVDDDPEDYIDFMHSEKFKNKFGFRGSKSVLETINDISKNNDMNFAEVDIKTNGTDPNLSQTNYFFRTRSLRKF